MQKPSHAKKGFTLIELLTVIAILAILGAIIFPTVGQFRSMAKRSSDAEDLRNIVTASHLLATQNGEKYVDVGQTVANGEIEDTGGSDILDVAAVLAVGGGINAPDVWVSANEDFSVDGSIVVAGTPNTTSYGSTTFSYDYVVGLASWMESTTPLAFTRMAAPGGTGWAPGDVYDEVGGHVAFIGGSVGWYEDLENKLVEKDGTAADTIQAVVDSYNADLGDSDPDIVQIVSAEQTSG